MTMTFFGSFDQNNQFYGNGGTFKIWLLQCYEVLWIHILTRSVSFAKKKGPRIQKFPNRIICVPGFLQIKQKVFHPIRAKKCVQK